MSPPPNFELTLKLFVFFKKMYVLELYILHTSQLHLLSHLNSSRLIVTF